MEKLTVRIIRVVYDNGIGIHSGESRVEQSRPGIAAVRGTHESTSTSINNKKQHKQHRKATGNIDKVTVRKIQQRTHQQGRRSQQAASRPMRGVLLVLFSSLVIMFDGREPPPPQSSTATPRPPPSSTRTPRRTFFSGSRPASSTLTPQDVFHLGESRRSAPRPSVGNLRVAARLERLKQGVTDIIPFTGTVYLILSNSSTSLRIFFLAATSNLRSGPQLYGTRAD